MERTSRHKVWSQVLLDQAESGLSKKDFCTDRGINAATFYYWQRRLEELKEHKEAGFQRLSPAEEHELTICLRDTIMVLRSPSPQTLAQVIKALVDA